MAVATEHFTALPVAVLTVSDTRDEATDTSGKYLQEALQAAGHVLADKKIVCDDIYRIRAVLSGWIADENVKVVLITGGTGFSGRDSTPEAVIPLFDKVIDGFGEIFRAYSLQEISPNIKIICVCFCDHNSSGLKVFSQSTTVPIMLNK